MTPDSVKVTQHAKERIIEHTGKSEGQAVRWAKITLPSAKYLCPVIDNDGKQARLYAAEGYNFIVAESRDVIVSVYPPRKQNNRLSNKITKIALQEVAKKASMYGRKERSLERLRADLEAEMSDVRRKLSRARAEHRKMALKGRLKALEMRIAEIPTEQYEVKRELTRYAIQAATYVR